MFKEDDNFISFDGTDEDLAEVLGRFGILDRINRLENPGERKKIEEELIERLRKSLDEIQALPVNATEGEPSAIIKGKYFNLRKIMFSALEVGANVLVVALIPPVGVALTAVTLLPSAISTISKIDEFAKSLSDAELAVYKSIKELSEGEKARGRIFEEEGVNRAEIENYFVELGQEIKGLDKALEMLVKKGILKERVGADEITTYYTINRF